MVSTRHCLAIVLSVAAAGVPAAEAYRWVDEKGVVNYYFPTVANPYTTLVRLRSGRIVSLDRIKRF